MKLPTIVKTGPSSWVAGSLSIDVEEVLNLRRKLVLELYSEFCPDVILIDHMPVGANGELKPLLELAATQTGRPRLYLGLRDIIDNSETIRTTWSKLDVYDYLELFDAVLIYGCQKIYDAGAAYGIHGNAREVAYCNYATIEPHAGLPNSNQKPFILGMGGGGSDFGDLAAVFLEACSILPKDFEFGAVVLTGPNMPPADKESLVALLASSSAKIVTDCHDARPWIQSASAVVSMAGYNSLCEMLGARAKALVVPRQGPSAEQRMRSSLLADRGLIMTTDIDSLSPDRLAENLVELLSGSEIPDVGNIPPLDGTQRATDILFSDVEGLESAH